MIFWKNICQKWFDYKNGLRPTNCVGVYDQDYIGEYIVALYNDTDKPQKNKLNNKITQKDYINLIEYITSSYFYFYLFAYYSKEFLNNLFLFL